MSDADSIPGVYSVPSRMLPKIRDRHHVPGHYLSGAFPKAFPYTWIDVRMSCGQVGGWEIGYKSDSHLQCSPLTRKRRVIIASATTKQGKTLVASVDSACVDSRRERVHEGMLLCHQILPKQEPISCRRQAGVNVSVELICQTRRRV